MNTCRNLYIQKKILVSQQFFEGLIYDQLLYITGSGVIYLYVALLVYEQVFRFQVSVDKVQSMQVLKGQHDLSSVEPSVRLTV